MQESVRDTYSYFKDGYRLLPDEASGRTSNLQVSLIVAIPVARLASSRAWSRFRECPDAARHLNGP